MCLMPLATESNKLYKLELEAKICAESICSYVSVQIPQKTDGDFFFPLWINLYPQTDILNPSIDGVL